MAEGDTGTKKPEINYIGTTHRYLMWDHDGLCNPAEVLLLVYTSDSVTLIKDGVFPPFHALDIDCSAVSVFGNKVVWII